MPHYTLRIPVETLRDEETVIIAYEGLPKHIDVKVMASTPIDAMKLFTQVLSTLIIEVQKGKIISLDENQSREEMAKEEQVAYDTPPLSVYVYWCRPCRALLHVSLGMYEHGAHVTCSKCGVTGVRDTYVHTGK